MPKASLTPLGRQLRCVLLNLRSDAVNARATQWRPSVASHAGDSIVSGHRLLARDLHQCRSYSGSGSTRSAASAAKVNPPEDTATGYQAFPSPPSTSPESHESLKPLRTAFVRRVRASRINSNALKFERAFLQEKTHVKGRVLVSNASSQGRYARQVRRQKSGRQGVNSVYDVTQVRPMKLEDVFARYIQHKKDRIESATAEDCESFTLQKNEADALQGSRYGINDMHTWAGSISPKDSLLAAEALAHHAVHEDWPSIPLFVVLHFLRRSFISFEALRIVIRLVDPIFRHRKSINGDESVSQNDILLLYLRLLKHARKVWPRSFEYLSEMLLSSFNAETQDDQDFSSADLRARTNTLNEAMRLTALPAAFDPFKNNRFQGAAILRILHFMANHEPPLQINRQGYRAVIALQLAQPKQPNEKLWAELKALSWPPYKEDRTAMDASITVEDHGMSKAAQTLQRMQEAGYAHLRWEKAALIYAGWDTDRTPTTQMLSLLASRRHFPNRHVAELWAARIATTRTAQEAWACYLSFEAQKRPVSHPSLYLAMFSKLRKEEQRQYRLGMSANKHDHSHRRKIYPGDVREVEALPPSSHLYTYTRTPPPTVRDFYRHLVQRGVAFQGRCLAFLIANSDSLKLGVDYLLESSRTFPILKQLVEFEQPEDLAQIPIEIFAAFIELLSRFSNLRFPVPSNKDSSSTKLHPSMRSISGWSIGNVDHCLVRAINLLAWRQPTYPPAWNSVLRCLARELPLDTIRFFPCNSLAEGFESPHTGGEPLPAVFFAYRFMERVLEIMRAVPLQPNSVGLLALCIGFENAAIAAWQILRAGPLDSESGNNSQVSSAFRTAECWMRESPHTRLRTEFRSLVGENDKGRRDFVSSVNSSDEIQVPHLKELPSPAVLHAYIRALGWAADYEGLKQTVLWMIANADELAIAQERDRNGEIMMRRAIVAIRTFLERRWLPETHDSNESSPYLPPWSTPIRIYLQRLESPAPEDVINEIRMLIESAEGWGGWPEDEEVEKYSAHARFQRFSKSVEKD